MPPATPHRIERLALHAGWFAALWFAGVLLIYTLAVPDGASAPTGNLGAMGAPHADWFNLLGLAMPGLLLFAFTLALERRLMRDGAGRAVRLGTGMLMLAALAFAAQDLFPFDPAEPDGGASQRHAMALALALLAQASATVFLFIGLLRLRGWRLAAVLLFLLGVALAATLIWPPQSFIPAFHGRPGAAQRLVLGLWFGVFVVASLTALKPARWRSTRR